MEFLSAFALACWLSSHKLMSRCASYRLHLIPIQARRVNGLSQSLSSEGLENGIVLLVLLAGVIALGTAPFGSAVRT